MNAFLLMMNSPCRLSSCLNPLQDFSQAVLPRVRRGAAAAFPTHAPAFFLVLEVPGDLLFQLIKRAV